jgi:molecular chaperone GrpE
LARKKSGKAGPKGRKKKRDEANVTENSGPVKEEASGSATGSGGDPPVATEEAEDGIDSSEDSSAATETATETVEIPLEERLERAERDAAAAADRALRTLAEFDNYRRRMQRELQSARDRSAAEVLTETLDVVDNFDRALEHAGEGVPEAFLEGMRLVARGLHDLLERRGVARIETVGTPFDPELHDALTSQPSEDVEPNTILTEIQSGYRMGDRVLRPAKVIVARIVEVEKDP